MNCYLCGGGEFTRRDGRVRDDPNAKIHQCSSCGLVFLSDIGRKDMTEFYKEGGMHGDIEPAAPINRWLKETARDDHRRFASLREELTNKAVLDFGCGAGGFLMYAKAVADSLAGVELEQRLAPHFKEAALDVRADVEQFPPEVKFDFITAFHVIEHLPDPRYMMATLKTRLAPGGSIIVEVPSADDALLTLFESKPFSQFTYWSCHIYLFNAHTMSLLARQAGLRVKYIKHIQRYPLSNHLYWLSNGKPGGHDRWGFLDSPELTAAYENALARIGSTDTILACLTH